MLELANSDLNARVSALRAELRSLSLRAVEYLWPAQEPWKRTAPLLYHDRRAQRRYTVPSGLERDTQRGSFPRYERAFQEADLNQSISVLLLVTLM
jgi:hypothetical protein